MRISKITMALAATALLAAPVTGSLGAPAGAAPAPACGWTTVRGPAAPGQLIDMTAVNALAKDDVRLGGFSYFPATFQPWLLGSDGRSVTEASTNVPTAPLTGSAAFAVSFSSAGEGWLLRGFDGFGEAVPLAARWHDNQWTTVPTAVSPEPKTKFVQLETLTTVSATDAWAFGFLAEYAHPLAAANTVVEHWDGTSWSMVPNPTEAEPDTFLASADVLSPSDIWAVGRQTDGAGSVVPLVEHWDGAHWQVVDSPAGTGPSALYAVSAAAPDDVWAVGAQTEAGTTNIAVPFVEHWDGLRWTESRDMPDVGNARVDDVFTAGPGDVWAIVEVPRGADRFLHRVGNAWTVVPAPGPAALELRYFYGAIDGTGPDDIWAVGEVTDGATVASTVQVAHYSCGRR